MTKNAFGSDSPLPICKHAQPGLSFRTLGLFNRGLMSGHIIPTLSRRLTLVSLRFFFAIASRGVNIHPRPRPNLNLLFVTTSVELLHFHYRICGQLVFGPKPTNLRDAAEGFNASCRPFNQHALCHGLTLTVYPTSKLEVRDHYVTTSPFSDL